MPMARKTSCESSRAFVALALLCGDLIRAGLRYSGWQLGSQLPLPVLVDDLAAATELMVNVRTPHSCHLVGDS